MGYILTSRGFGRLRGRRLGAAYDSAYSGYTNQDPSIVPTVATSLPRPAACSWTDYIWPSAACSLALGQQQIQSVPANAAAANAVAIAAGMAPPYDVAMIQAVADQQTTAFAGDNATIFTQTTAVSLSDPSTWPWYYWALLAGGVFAVLEFRK